MCIASQDLIRLGFHEAERLHAFIDHGLRGRYPKIEHRYYVLPSDTSIANTGICSKKSQ